MIQFIVGALAVVGLSELAKSKKMPKMANGGMFPDEVIGNDGIIHKKEWEKMNDGRIIAKYNQYYKGYDIDYGGHIFSTTAELEKFVNNYILSNNLYNKYKYMANGGSMSDDIIQLERGDIKKSRVEKFFSLLFESRDVAHKEHLKTKSYATHIALNEYYEGVLPLIDGMVESYQGIYGIVEIPEWTPKYENPIIYLKDLLNTIDREKDELFTDSSLLNQIDEIKALVQSTLYKLENLK